MTPRSRKSDAEKDPAAAALGRKGGLRGGPARAAALSATQRTYASRFAASTRWTMKRYQDMTHEVAIAPLVKVARTHVLMITDMSGSIQEHKLTDDVRGGFNNYLAELSQDHEGSYLVSATLFHTQFIPLFTERRPGEAIQLTHQNYTPGGNTALLDAVASTLTDFGEVPQGDNAICVIQTDGEENSSHRWTREQVKAMIEERQASGRWLFLFLGAGPETWHAAGGLGVSAGTTFATPQTAVGTRSAYRGAATATQAWNATNSAQAAAAGYLGTPGAVDPFAPPPAPKPKRFQKSAAPEPKKRFRKGQ